MILAILLAILAAYVIGATPFGFLAGKLKGVDVRTMGSGNIGATNVFRVIGKAAGIAVFVLDFLKGLIPVLVAQRLAAEGTFPDWVPIPVALGTILGHNYTFWLGFRGGKGIATSAGAIVGLLPVAVGVALAVWILLMAVTRYVAVASMGAAVAIPVVVIAAGWRAGDWNWPLVGFSVLVAVLAIVRHRGNIARLRAGTEHRFGKKEQESEGGEG